MVSGSEVAFFSLSTRDKQELEESKTKGSDSVLKLLERPKKLLATILITNNFINVAIVLLSSFISQQIFVFDTINLGFMGFHDVIIDSTLQNFLLNVIVITFLILLIGEVIPKVYATKNPIQLAELMAFPFIILNRIFHPLSIILVQSTTFIDKRYKKKTDNISVDELSHALEITSDQSNSSDEEQKILKGIVKFGNTDVKQIMTPRIDVIAFDINTQFQELLSAIVASGFSRIPIFEGDFDQIKGILYIKDLLPFIEAKDDFNWQTLIREPFYVPENKKIDDLLEEFQERKIHLAIVVDEYGGSQGIISLEDVIEEIVGEIADEFDEDDLVYSKIDDFNYVFEAKTPLKDVYKVLDIDGENFEESKGEADTLGGFIVEISGKIPKKNERIKFEDYLFTIEAADKRKVKSVKITLNDYSEEDDSGQNKGSDLGKVVSIVFLMATLGLGLISCEEEAYTPKPRSFFRIDLPHHEYQQSELSCPFTFEYSTSSIVNTKETEGQPCWFNLLYPKLNATVHFTYFDVDQDSIFKYAEDARSFAMKHTVKADDIEESIIYDTSANIYGTIYDFEGSVASNYQFFITDSTQHFLRGAMYFNALPNPDSLAPAEAYIKQDLLHLIESFSWK